MNAPSPQRTRESVSQGRPSSHGPILGPNTVDAAFEDQSFIAPIDESQSVSALGAKASDPSPLLGNFAKQLTALKEQEARLRELLRTSRKA
ncbi:MAG: hypothetical protein RH917_15995 [Lacipirellulaceae bacterium]